MLPLLNAKCVADTTREIQQFNDAKLNIQAFKEEYSRKVGLSDNEIQDENVANLPLHPDALLVELDDYKALIDRCIDQKVREGIWQILFEGSSLEDLSFERRELEYACLTLQNEHETSMSEIDGFYKDMESIAEEVEESYQTLASRVIELTRTLDELRVEQQELARIDALVGNQNLLTVETARAQVDELTDGYVKLSMANDDRMETIYDLAQRVEEGEREVETLLAEMIAAEGEASEALRSQGHKDEELERQQNWYNSMLNLSHQLDGAENIDSNLTTQLQQ
ncbi:hypothetical protein EC973_009168 [Apophysomyces ossiformis]|uniref:Uncharacterized protein n=1 Tax=Apophysomyces ossiformis TaxID=679940 RepID=A0A8H7BVY0_9FUNG|nr:hypothetical protein EC973_009168 [Apophysomyces ossiformis]